MKSIHLSQTPLELDHVAVPTDVRVEGGCILWTRDESNGDPPLEGFTAGAPVERIIWEFLELKTATPEDIASFARVYGVLGIRTDGLPGIAPSRGGVNIFPIGRTEDADGYWYIEPVAPWRMYSVALRTLFAVAIEIRDNEKPDWSTLCQRWGLDAFTWESFGLPISNIGEESVSELYALWVGYLAPDFLIHNLRRVGSKHQREWLAYFVSDSWIRWGGAVPRLTWSLERPSMMLELSTAPIEMWPPNSLFSVVISQLIQILSGEEFGRMTQCSVCGRLFLQQIKTGRHERSYCDEHKIEAQREKKRRWARKKAAERKAKQDI